MQVESAMLRNDMRLPIMPLNSVVYPWMPVVLTIFEDRYLQMLEEVLRGPRFFGTALIAEGKEVGGPATPHPVGVEVIIARAWPAQEGSWRVIGIGRHRFRISGPVSQEPYPSVEADYAGLKEIDDAPAELVGRVRELFCEHLKLLAQLVAPMAATMEIPTQPSRLSYMVAAHLAVDLTVRQRLLEIVTARERLQVEAELLKADIAKFRLFARAVPSDPGKAEHN
ncbi:MAG: LON peptidase substrate-binding domain-containing protein [Armatimonadetes bacterium]|nr:LON peptidase substrate-binding domain-containing protein [Armatimonadota bacterium]